MPIKASPHAHSLRPWTLCRWKAQVYYPLLCTMHLMIRLEMYSLNFKPFNLSNADLSVVINRNEGTQYACFIGVNGPYLQVCIFKGFSTYLWFTANFSLNPQLSSNPALRFVGHGGKDTAEVMLWLNGLPLWCASHASWIQWYIFQMAGFTETSLKRTMKATRMKRRSIIGQTV